MNYDRYFQNALDRLRDERRYRVFADLERLAGRFPRAIWHSPHGPRDVIVWCSNDYLGMGQHPKVIGAMVATATRMGTGAGGTRNIAGTNHPLVELERELADLHGKEAALVFTSGYVSNETGISTIAKLLPNCLILSDEWNHNSMIEGVRQSKCEKQIFRHNDMAHLEELLQMADQPRPKLIVFETLYSMDGSGRATRCHGPPRRHRRNSRQSIRLPWRLYHGKCAID
jgi:5-aminolevulinate synthase